MAVTGALLPLEECTTIFFQLVKESAACRVTLTGFWRIGVRWSWTLYDPPFFPFCCPILSATSVCMAVLLLIPFFLSFHTFIARASILDHLRYPKSIGCLLPEASTSREFYRTLQFSHEGRTNKTSVVICKNSKGQSIIEGPLNESCRHTQRTVEGRDD